MKVLNALNSLAEDDTLRTSKLSQPINPMSLLGSLTKTVDFLQSKIDYPTTSKPTLDALKAAEAFHLNGYDFTKLEAREKRALCIDPRTAVSRRVVKAVDQHRDILNRASTLNGFAICYFSKWREIKERERLEALLVTVIQDQSKRRKAKYLSIWAEHPRLFSADADKQIAREAVSKRLSVAEVCGAWFIVRPSQLDESAAEAALEMAVSNIINRPTTATQLEIRTELKWIIDKLVLPSLSGELYRREMGRLILSNLTDRCSEAAPLLVEQVKNDTRLGDPRLSQSQSNWQMMPAGSRERLFSWLARETIEFFFDVLVPPGDENRRRAEFWLMYARRPGNIKDFQVAVSEEDARLIRRKQMDAVAYPELEGQKTSAFMMQFEGYDGNQYVIVEFSETGNAAYVYDRRNLSTAKLSFRSQRFTLDQLKRRYDKSERIIHNGDWENKARYMLAELGIRP